MVRVGSRGGAAGRDATTHDVAVLWRGTIKILCMLRTFYKSEKTRAQNSISSHPYRCIPCISNMRSYRLFPRCCVHPLLRMVRSVWTSNENDVSCIIMKIMYQNATRITLSVHSTRITRARKYVTYYMMLQLSLSTTYKKPYDNV